MFWLTSVSVDPTLMFDPVLPVIAGSPGALVAVAQAADVNRGLDAGARG